MTPQLAAPMKIQIPLWQLTWANSNRWFAISDLEKHPYGKPGRQRAALNLVQSNLPFPGALSCPSSQLVLPTSGSLIAPTHSQSGDSRRNGFGFWHGYLSVWRCFCLSDNALVEAVDLVEFTACSRNKTIFSTWSFVRSSSFFTSGRKTKLESPRLPNVYNVESGTLRIISMLSSAIAYSLFCSTNDFAVRVLERAVGKIVEPLSMQIAVCRIIDRILKLTFDVFPNNRRSALKQLEHVSLPVFVYSLSRVTVSLIRSLRLISNVNALKETPDSIDFFWIGV